MFRYTQASSERGVLYIYKSIHCVTVHEARSIKQRDDFGYNCNSRSTEPYFYDFLGVQEVNRLERHNADF